ncbi:pre-mRNA-splicing factor CWC21-like protein [Dinothrombium tinctorium]|uniref:Pre-mRNA-splicing factor CWC21-like protein n=1 Tax=Dinothrombium tinctorium TaxID=1965070 RepID=A0A3S3S812_9ACAR|nr:pre-mRNA-splicing factor CWC21-like protein [Dinothrombium tinctorium]
MYNGIGLQTARGSGTNAYVQRNLSFVNKLKPKVEYKTEDDIKKLEASVNRQPNEAILMHQRKRQIEVKCLELREKMEEQGYTEEEIETKIDSYRETLKKKAEEAIRKKELFMNFDENGRPL